MLPVMCRGVQTEICLPSYRTLKGVPFTAVAELWHPCCRSGSDKTRWHPCDKPMWRRESLPAGEVQRYEAQYRFIQQICALYEEEPNDFGKLFTLIQEVRL